MRYETLRERTDCRLLDCASQSNDSTSVVVGVGSGWKILLLGGIGDGRRLDTTADDASRVGRILLLLNGHRIRKRFRCRLAQQIRHRLGHTKSNTLVQCSSLLSIDAPLLSRDFT